ncbi:DUF4870 domain-containing protein [Paenibacillus sp. J22TS3]|uniref:DUF4870 domain-containing protein n=1 Tax=Paenibacillus sp. J22TS3 TaxID=2807192 RepID=UPI001B081496|nr:DUF4870 domain-containing protein [Paenibacillus sp. J22TS3]GIP22459.1 membrane protein [Paenibacillus sp. J22TS3]
MRPVLASLSYFSIFFAPFLLPVVVWFVSNDVYVRRHAGKALFSHIFPILAAIPMFYFMFTAQHPGSILLYIILFAVIYFGSFLYNIVQGIRVLSNGGWPEPY